MEKASSSLKRMNFELNDLTQLNEVSLYDNRMNAYYGELNAKIASAPRFGIII